MKAETILGLQQISTPKKFLKDSYICTEGQLGNEMYIVLSGSVGIFITSAIGTLTKVAQINAGDFFGEMAIFDNLPRSASCIALEETIAVSINKTNLQSFLEMCPEIAKQMLENMSGRIRKLDDELYKNSRFVKNRHIQKFRIPATFNMGHAVKIPYQNPKLINQYKQACPICGRAITVNNLKRNILEERSYEMDCRITYVGCDPLWLEIISCPYCKYSNHYLEFFKLNNFEFELISELLEKEHKSILESRVDKRSEFDILVIKYLQAININEHINPNNNALIGGLWRNVYWLSKDVPDLEFAKYCAKMAIEKYKAALKEEQIKDAVGIASTAISLCGMLAFLGQYEEISKYIDIAAECEDERIKNNALKVKERLNKMN